MIPDPGARLVKPVRIQRQRTKGWRMPPNTVFVGRRSRWGNPFRPHPEGLATMAREGLADDFRRWLTHYHQPVLPDRPNDCWCARLPDRDVVMASLPMLRGKNLACWCPLDQPCHADVLLELANA